MAEGAISVPPSLCGAPWDLNIHPTIGDGSTAYLVRAIYSKAAGKGSAYAHVEKRDSISHASNIFVQLLCRGAGFWISYGIYVERSLERGLYAV